MRWAKEHESFGKALGEGKGVSDAKVIRSLYERATGYEYEEEKKIIEYDKDGNVKPVKIEKTKKHVPPDVTAQIFWLKNRQRDRWQDRPQDYVDQTSDNDAEVQIYLPDNGSFGDSHGKGDLFIGGTHCSQRPRPVIVVRGIVFWLSCHTLTTCH